MFRSVGGVYSAISDGRETYLWLMESDGLQETDVFDKSVKLEGVNMVVNCFIDKYMMQFSEKKIENCYLFCVICEFDTNLTVFSFSYNHILRMRV